MSTATKSAPTNHTMHIGRAGALAVALGIGTAIATSAAAYADDGGTKAPHASTSSSTASAAPAARHTSNRSAAPAAAVVKPASVTLQEAPQLPKTSTAAATKATTPARGPVATFLAAVVSALGSAPAAAKPSSGVASAAATSTGTPTAAATAAPSNVTIEAESLTFTAKFANTITDSTATGKKALQLTTNGTASTTVSLPAFTNVIVRAKGDQYQGAPNMVVSVDGKVVATVDVSATTWTDYSFAVSGNAGTHTISIGYTNDVGDRRLKLDTITVVAGSASSTPTPPSNPTPANSAPFFQGADWLWNPIASNATVATNSATWVSYFSAAGAQHSANLYQYGVTLVNSSQVTSATPRYSVKFTKAWGSDPFAGSTVGIPKGTKIPPGSDGQIAIMDPVAGRVFGIWQAKYNSSTDTWSASWGGSTPINGNGVDTSGSATAAGISRYAGVVTAAEFSAAVAANSSLNHALVFSTDIAGAGFVGPAIKSDGSNIAAVAVPIPEGYRIQLDPSINVDAIVGISAAEKVIAKTLQTYGAYVVDQGGARMAFSFEAVSGATATDPGSVWTNAGLSWDYYDMDDIPWTQLRVLAS